ncbi:bifunctional RecB family nuclease/DEAD/DEAH box helicase [Nocardia lasii]|uniref:AAA domain-containing protein n=1 Tax=Nocardia lasii TaxID=1616107 RepID=A0ABW1K0A1_9NOCA
MSGDRVVGAVGDLARAANCEFAVLRAIDAALGNLPGFPDTTAPLVRATEPSAELLAHFGDRLVRIPSPEAPGADAATRIAALTVAAEQTTRALRAGAEAIHGAVFFDGHFACGATLLVRSEGSGGDGESWGWGVGSPVEGPRYTLHGALGSAVVGVPGGRVSRADGIGGQSLSGRVGSEWGSPERESDRVSGGPGFGGQAPVGRVGSEWGSARGGSAAGRASAAWSRAGSGASDDAAVGTADVRPSRRELAAGRTPFERAAATARAVKVDPVRELLCARLEFAACARALGELGVGVEPVAYLWAADGVRGVGTEELAALYAARRARVETIIEDKLAELLPVQWGDPRYLACTRCPSCRAAATNARDLLLVAGIRPTQRARLREAGVLTIDRLATTNTPVPGLAPRTLSALRHQADLQLVRERTGRPAYTLRDPAALGALPAPRPGDLALVIDLDQHGAITGLELTDATSVIFRPSITDPDHPLTFRRTSTGPTDTNAIVFGPTGAEPSNAAGYPSADRPDAGVIGYPGGERSGADSPGYSSGARPDVGVTGYPSIARPGTETTGYAAGEPNAGATGYPSAGRSGADATGYPGVERADAGVTGYRSAGRSGADVTGYPSGERPDSSVGEADTVPFVRVSAAYGASARSAVRQPPGGGVLEELLEIIAEHRAADPGVRVYHYGSAVRTALLDGAGQLGTGADLLDELLVDGALVDLAPIVRTALLIGEQSYDATGLATLVPGASGRAAIVLGLRDWLLERAAEAGIAVPGARFVVAESEAPPSLNPGSLEAALSEFAVTAQGDSARAAALMAAVLGYHRRERQPRWWAHIDRLAHPVGEWADAPGVLIGEWGTVDTKWHRTPQLPTMRRYLTLTGRLGTGATLTPGTQMVTIYDGAAAAGMTQTLGRRATATATVLGCAVDQNFDDTVRLEELLPAGCPPYDDLPAAIAPGPPEGEADSAAALELSAGDLLVSLPWVPENAVYDLLLRRAPRLRDGMDLPHPRDDLAAVLAHAVGALDASYLAVHGPPGTGKTGITGRALEKLVTRHKWRIGVVAQSHAVIERIFDAVVEAGVLPELVAKKDVASVGPEWSAIEADRYPRFLDNAVNGCVIGGTTADFVDDRLIAPGSLDLLVVADAGACSLADTLAIAVSARNLLLIGDPVPATAQAKHPQPVHVSALEWLCEGAATLPADRGYFLDRTWRMHPAVCAPVSASCYDGRLRADESITLARDLAGITPGVSTVLVEHRGSATESDAEAREVVRRVRALLGETWTSGGRTRKLHPHDVFVVAPYAAQVARIRTLLARAKIEDVLVGTPDRFRGREAAVVLLSMTTSTPADAPFGMRPLLSRTVIHATLCRAMWKAIVIRSPLLTEYLPETPEELADLVGFLQLD